MDGGATASAGGGSVANLGGFEGWWSTSGIALWSLVLFGSFLLNATLLLAFVKLPRLRTISNRFVMNLTASNLLTCSLLTPLLMLDVPTDSCTRRLCAVAEGVTALVTASSVLSVLLIAVDQYFAVVDPLRYRGRVNKLKCGIVIGSVWVVSILFGFLATFNPDPRSLWLFCGRDEVALTTRNFSLNSTMNLTFDSSVVFGNGSEGDYNVKGELEISEDSDGSRFTEDLEFTENSTILLGETSFLESFDDANVTFTCRRRPYYRGTYGLVYTTVYSVFVYLLPFVGICWIYVSIYLAAHKNSERTRRTASGPTLSSASFCEDYCQVRQECSSEDFRRIPKISSLSSIDESTETAPSQMPRRRSEVVLTSTIEEMSPPVSTVVFTVGSQKVNVTPQRSAKADEAKETSKVPISTLKAEFLGKREEGRLMDELVRSKFLDRPDDRRKSSHDLMYEEMLKRDLGSPRDNEDFDGEEEMKEMLQTFTETRRLRDIEVSECQNSIDDRANRVPPMQNDDLVREVDLDVERTTLKNANFALAESQQAASDYHPDDQIVSSRFLDNDVITKTDPEDHGAPSKVQNGRVTNGRFSSGNHRSLESSGDLVHGLNTFAEVDSSSSLLSNSTSTPMVTVTPPNRIPLHRVSSIKSTSSYINSLKYRISNASLFKYREETRAARISALVIVMGFICWTPYVVVLNLRNLLGYENEDLAHKYDVLALSLLILAAYVSPLLFGYRSRRVKRELRKIFCFRKELSYKNNRSLMAKKVLKRRHSSNLSQFEVDSKYNIFSCVYGRNRWPKEKVQFMQVPETALAVETCRSSFSSGASTQISSTSTDEC